MLSLNVDEARTVKVVVVPIGNNSLFDVHFQAVSNVRRVPFYELNRPNAANTSPFPHFSWTDGTLLFDFLRYDRAAPGDISNFQSSKRVLVIMGLINYPELVASGNKVNVDEEMDFFARRHPHALLRRHFVFNYSFDDHIPAAVAMRRLEEHRQQLPPLQRTIKDQDSLVIFPPDGNCGGEGGVSMVDVHMQEVMSHAALTVVQALELQMGVCERARLANVVPEAIPLCTPHDDLEDVGAVGALAMGLARVVGQGSSPLPLSLGVAARAGNKKAYKRRPSGRLHKWMGDLCLQVCSPRDALDHYTLAIAECRSLGETLWLAGALEGVAGAVLLLLELRAPLQEILGRELRLVTLPADGAGGSGGGGGNGGGGGGEEEEESAVAERKAYRWAELRLAEAAAIYALHGFAPFEVCCLLRSAHLHETGPFAQHREAKVLDCILQALSVPGLPPQQQVEATVEGALLCRRLGLQRKAALLLYLAALLSAESDNYSVAQALMRHVCAACGLSPSPTQGLGDGPSAGVGGMAGGIAGGVAVGRGFRRLHDSGDGDWTGALAPTSTSPTSASPSSPSPPPASTPLAWPQLQARLFSSCALVADELGDSLAATENVLALLRLMMAGETQHSATRAHWAQYQVRRLFRQDAGESSNSGGNSGGGGIGMGLGFGFGLGMGGAGSGASRNSGGGSSASGGGGGEEGLSLAHFFAQQGTEAQAQGGVGDRDRDRGRDRVCSGASLYPAEAEGASSAHGDGTGYVSSLGGSVGGSVGGGGLGGWEQGGSSVGGGGMGGNGGSVLTPMKLPSSTSDSSFSPPPSAASASTSAPPVGRNHSLTFQQGSDAAEGGVASPASSVSISASVLGPFTSASAGRGRGLVVPALPQRMRALHCGDANSQIHNLPQTSQGLGAGGDVAGNGMGAGMGVGMGVGVGQVQAALERFLRSIAPSEGGDVDGGGSVGGGGGFISSVPLPTSEAATRDRDRDSNKGGGDSSKANDRGDRGDVQGTSGGAGTAGVGAGASAGGGGGGGAGGGVMVAGAEAVAREGARRFAGDALQAAAHILAHSRYSIALQSEGLGLFRRLSRLLPSSSLPLPLALLCLLPVELQGRRRPCLLAAPAVGAAQRGLAQLRSARQGHGVREGVLADAGSGEGEGDEDGNAGAGAGMGAEDGTDPTPAPKGSLFYDPFEARRLRALAQAAAAAGEQLLWATGEPCVLLAVLSNPLSVPLSVLAYPVLQGACWVFPQTLEIPPRSRFEVRLPLLPREAGQLRVLGLKLVINNVAHLLRVDEKGRGVGEGQGQGVGQESAGSGGSAGVGAGSGAGAGMGAIPGTSSTNTVTVVPPALPLLLAASWAQVRMEPETEAQVREAEAEVDMQTGAVETGAGAGGLAVVRSSVELALLPGEARTETVFVLLEPLASLALGAGMAMGAGPGVGVEAGVSTTGTSQYPSQSLSLCDFRVTIREVPTCAGQSQGQGKSIGQGQRRTPPAQSLPLLDFAGPLASVEGAEAEVGSGSGSGMGMGMGAGGGCTLVAHRLHTGADKGQGGGEGGRCALSLQLRFQQSDSVAAVDVEVEAASGQLLGLVRALKHMGAGTEAGSGTVGGGADLALLQALAEPGVGAEAGADLRVYSRVLRLRVWLRREPGVQLLQVRALGCRQLPSPHEARALTSALRLLLASTSRFRGVQGQGQGWGQQQQWALTHTSEQRGHGEEKEREKGKEKGKGDCDSGGDLCIRMLSESTDVAIEVANESDWEMQLCVAITTVADARLRLPPPPLLPLGSSGGSGALAFAPQQVMQYAALLGGAGAGTGAGMLTGAEMGTGSLLLLPARSARTVVVRYPTAAPAHAPSSAPGALRVQWSLLDDALPAHVAEEGAGAGTERGAGRRVRSGFVPVPLQLMPAPSPTCPSPSPSPFSFPTPSAYAVQGACQGQSEGQEQGEGQRTGLDVAFSTISLSDTAPLSPTPTPATTPAPASSALTPAGGSASVSVPMTVYGGDLGLQLHRDSPLLRPLLSRMPPLSVQLSFEPAPANAATTKSNAGAGTAGYDAPSLSLPLPLPLPLASVGGVPCFSLRRARFYDVCVSIGATATARAVTDSDAASGAGRASGSGAAMGAPLRLELVLLAAPSEAPVVRRRDQPAARCSPTPTPALPPTSTLEVEEAEAGARLGAGAGAGARHCVFTGRPYAQYTLLGSGSGSSSGSSGSGDGGGNGRGGGCRDVGGDVGSEGMGMVEHRLRVCLPRSGSFSLVAAVRLVGAEAEARGAGTWWTSPAAYVHLVVS